MYSRRGTSRGPVYFFWLFEAGLDWSRDQLSLGSFGYDQHAYVSSLLIQHYIGWGKIVFFHFLTGLIKKSEKAADFV